MQVDTVDKTVFIQAMQPVYDRFLKENPNWAGLVDKIRASK
jgi:TRAP-type C4-dicarboxylate transport system substrate-binding protein